jgi:hypothetical protein
MRRWLVVLLAAVLSACSGGGGRAVPAPSTSASGGSTALTTANIEITVPRAASANAHARTPAYLSSSTQSVTINVTPNLSTTPLPGFPMTANLTSTSSGCSSTQSGTLCVVPLTLAPGTYDATLSTFDGTNATGNKLSAAQDVPFTVVLNQTNTIPLVLGGTPASMQIVAGTGVTVASLSVYTLAANSTGTLDVYGVDADGNTIIGAGAPTVTATTSSVTQIAITQPTATSPNVVGVSTLSSSAIADVTLTITPASGAGGSTLSKTAVVQASFVPLLYIASSQGHVFDLTGTEITVPGSAFATAFSGAGGTGLTYDPNNGLLYATESTQGNTVGEILAFDRSGNLQTLNAADSSITPDVGGIVFDPISNLLYVGNESTAYDPSGNPQAISTQLPYTYNLSFNTQTQQIVDGTKTFNAAGSLQSTLPFTGQIDAGAIYNPYNGLYYVATVYPTAVTAYNASGTPQTLSGTFINGSSEQIGGIVADAATGNIYLATNARNTYGFDSNGNPLPLPWHTITTVGAGSGAAGLVLAPP